MNCLTKKIYIMAEKEPDKPAVICENNILTYSDLAKCIKSVYHFFISCNIHTGNPVGILLPNGIDFVIAMLAISEIGAGIVPLSPFTPVAQIDQLYQSLGVQCVIADDSIVNKISNYRAVSIPDDLELNDCDIKSDDFGDQIFIISATSGSTGNPKPIRLRLQTVYQRAAQTNKFYHLTEKDVLIASTPLHHTLAERLVLMPLLIGATAVIMPHFTAKKWIDAVSKFHVTFSILVSSQIKNISVLLYDNKQKISSLRTLVSSSDKLDSNTKQYILENSDFAFHEIYGTSEIAAVTDIDFRQYPLKLDSVGKPIHNTEIIILSDNGETVSRNQIGEIVCRTDLIFQGYSNSDAPSDGWFHTGDLGYIDEDGFVYYTGRKKEVIIVGGVNVFPSDIENVVKELPFVKDVIVCGIPDELLGEVPWAAVELAEGYEESQCRKNIFKHCLHELSDIQLPRKVIITDCLPYNALHKPLRTELVKSLLGG